jgi:hypothetical protein
MIITEDAVNLQERANSAFQVLEQFYAVVNAVKN